MDGHPQRAEAIDPPTQIGRHRFNGRAVQAAGFQPPFTNPGDGARSFGQIGNPFPHVERQPNHATTTRLHLGRQLGQLGMITLKGRSNFFHHPGGVHRAQQRQPSPAGTTERRDQPFGVNDRTIRVRKRRGRGAQTDDHHARCRRPSTNGTHHVVAAPRRHRCAFEQARPRRACGRNLPGPLRRFHQRRQSAFEVPTNLGHPLGIKRALLHVKEARARSVAGLHRSCGGELEVDVVVGKHHGGGAGPRFWLMLLQPKHFGCSEAHRDRGPKALRQFFGLLRR